MCTCLYHVQLMAITLINARTCMLSRDQARDDVISKNIVTSNEITSYLYRK